MTDLCSFEVAAMNRAPRHHSALADDEKNMPI
jgi:hypothetical protein